MVEQRQKIHLIGIAGKGMSALAKLLLERGAIVSGSDRAGSASLEALGQIGIQVYDHHSAHNVNRPDLVIYSPAVGRDNVELRVARENAIVIYSRARALASILKGREYISVAGSHGKTTVSAMLTRILQQAGRSPGFMIGACLSASTQQNAQWNEGSIFVAETCEAFRGLDYFEPSHVIVTNIDDEHTEHFGSFDRLKATYVALIEHTARSGHVVFCADDPQLTAVAKEMGKQAISYGFSKDAAWRIHNLKMHRDGSMFVAVSQTGQSVSLQLSIPGEHNVLNALAAFAMAQALKVPLVHIVQALATYQSVARRWDLVGSAHGVDIFDDFAHHPTEITATLAVARTTAGPQGRVIVLLEPLLHSRVQRLAQDFARALAGADQCIILPVNGSAEPEPTLPSDIHLHGALLAQGCAFYTCVDIVQAARTTAMLVRAGDVVVTMGTDKMTQCALMIMAQVVPQNQYVAQQVPARSKNVLEKSDTANHNRLHSGFEKMASLRPTATCVIDGEQTWTYQKIDVMANQVAFQLRTRGLGPDDLVVLRLNKSPYLIVLILGVLKAGCGFLPVDPNMARVSIGASLKRAGVKLVISDDDHWLHAISDMVCINMASLFSFAPIATSKSNAVSSNHLAYAIFTSGSMGEPRLVGVEHRNVTNVLDYAAEALFEPQDLALVPFIDSISFDASIHQIFATFAMGGALLIVPDLQHLLRSPHFECITALGATPSIISRLMGSVTLPKSLRIVMLGGEVISQTLLARLREVTHLRQVLNLYGPTETTIYCTVAQLLNPQTGNMVDPDLINGRYIGSPIRNIDIHIVDDIGQPVVDGLVGEIIISGQGVSRGYLDDPVLTHIHFEVRKLAGSSAHRCYRSGDLGRRLPDGSLIFLGRKDDQLKVNGIRFEPLEIERVLQNCPGIDRAAVVLSTTHDDIPELVAYVVAKPQIDLTRVRSWIAPKLPLSLIPRLILRVDDLPLSVSGKLDRRRLSQMMPLAEVLRPNSPPSDQVQRKLLAIWQTALRRPDLGIDDDFFQFGGDSMAAFTLVVAVENAFNSRLPAQALETLCTVQNMASYLKEGQGEPMPVQEEIAQALGNVRNFMTAWKGERRIPESFIVTLNSSGSHKPLFWCCQAFSELAALADAMSPLQPIHGMRSGHQAFEYKPDTIEALAAHYAHEIMLLQPEEAISLGGNCQGGVIARATAYSLRAKGRSIKNLVMMEQGAFWPYDEPVSLVFGQNSPFNPRHRMSNPALALDQAYPCGYVQHFISGTHGEFFNERNIQSLARTIEAILHSQD